jgi:hypothetical protein
VTVLLLSGPEIFKSLAIVRCSYAEPKEKAAPRPLFVSASKRGLRSSVSVVQRLTSRSGFEAAPHLSATRMIAPSVVAGKVGASGWVVQPVTLGLLDYQAK